tara:strand:- start:321 stop:728 length:408 start_codon:yes stop_codon:yes gene_type:complete
VRFTILNPTEIKKFKKFINVPDQGEYIDPDEVFSFEHICPIPEAETQMDEYNWRCENWGTKWGAVDLEIDDEEYEGHNAVSTIIQLNFETAWSPAEGIYQAIIKKIEEEGWDIYVSWFYDEPGMEIAGYLKYQPT